MKLALIFLLIVVIVALVMTGVAMSRHEEGDIDSQYIDENGDHVYYDRSLIEKKDYMRRYPDDKNIRRLRNLFYRKR